MLKLKKSPTGRRHGGPPADRLAGAEALLRRSAELHAAWNAGTADSDALEESCRLLGRLTAVHPERIGLSVVRGMQLRHLGRYEESERVLAAAAAADPADPEARLEHAHALLMRGDWARGFAKYECRITNYAAYGRDDPEFPGIPRWDGKPIDGTLLLNGTTDGRGDAIFAIRLAVEARRLCTSTALVTYPGLERLLARAPGVDRVIPYEKDLRPQADAQVSLLSLPHCLERNRAQLPAQHIDHGAYLSADPETIDRWRPGVESIPGFRVGICWQGNPRYAMDKLRSFPLSQFAPVAAVPGVSLISLQVDNGVATYDWEHVGAQRVSEQISGCGFPVRDFSRPLHDGDFLDTAAIISQLDLVIAPDTAVAHLAGAMGKPVWVVNATPPDWRWAGTGETSPWYRSARVFRQTGRRDWSGVFDQVAEELADRVRG